MGKKKGGRGQKKGGMPGVSKGIKKALKNMPKAERQMVAEGLSGGGRAAMSWSVKRLADQRATKVAASQAPQKNGGEGARVGQSALAVISKPNQRILVIGDGNFSFAASLVSLFNGDGSSITATVYDSREVLKSKYADADQHVASLQAAGAVIYYEMDGTTLEHESRLDPPYDCVVFNFPHVGRSIQDQSKNIVANQELITGFLKSAATVCHDTSAICLTVKKGEPYDSWRVARIGIALPETRLRLKTAVDFEPRSFPGFVHRRTAGHSDKEGEYREDNGLISHGAKTFVFQLDVARKDQEEGTGRKKKKKHGSGMGKGGVIRGPVAKGSRGPKQVR